MYKNQRALSIDYQSKSLHNTSKSRGVCVARVYRWRNRRKKSQSRRDRVHPGVFSFHFRLHCLQLTSTQSIDFTITCRWRESTFSLDEQYSNKCNAIQVQAKKLKKKKITIHSETKFSAHFFFFFFFFSRLTLLLFRVNESLPSRVKQLRKCARGPK